MTAGQRGSTHHVMGMVALVAAFAGGCGTGSRVVRIVDQVNANGTYSTRDVRLTTLDDVRTVRGSVAVVRGGAAFDLNADNPIDGGGIRSQVVQHAQAVNATWVMDGDVIVPADYDSLAMLTAYADFERSAQHFAALGVASATDRVRVYYHPSIPNNATHSLPQTDNAAYFTDIDSFILLPMVQLQQIPFPMNVGVIGHEYAHRVWYYETWGGHLYSALRAHQHDAGGAATWNRLRGTDEGVADFFGAAISNNPRFLAASAPADIAAPRRLDRRVQLDPSWVGGTAPLDDRGIYNPYALGSVVSSSLWALAQADGLHTVESAVIDAERSLTPQLVQSFTYAVGDMAIAVLRALSPAQRQTGCTLLQTSYAPVWNRFAAVCP